MYRLKTTVLGTFIKPKYKANWWMHDLILRRSKVIMTDVHKLDFGSNPCMHSENLSLQEKIDGQIKKIRAN